MSSYSLEIKNKYATYVEALSEEATGNNGYDEHAHHDELEIYQFIDGELFFSFEGERIPVKGGDVIIIASGSLHRTIICNQCRYFRKRILVKNGFFASLPTGAIELKARLNKKKLILIDKQKFCGTELEDLLNEIEISIKKQTQYSDFCAMTALAAFLIKAEGRGDFGKEHFDRIGNKVADIVKYIDDNITSPLTYKHIAEKFHLSEKNLYKLFKSETGFSLSKYVKMRRIIKAKYLLNSGEPPSAASELAGFSDYSVFYRSFVSETGTSPIKYATQKNS